MTLAEVFLLLLIVGWYGSRLESEEKGEPGVPATVPKAMYDEVKNERDRLEKDLAEEKTKYEQLTLILDWIAKTAGLPKPIRTLEEAQQAIKTIQSEARRGRPACNTADNTLVSVIADNGQVTVTLRLDFPPGADSKFASGTKFQGPVPIDGFLAQIDRFYEEQRSKSNNNCVFDFTLGWRTDADYRLAGELFEHHFYPAGRKQLQ